MATDNGRCPSKGGDQQVTVDRQPEIILYLYYK